MTDLTFRNDFTTDIIECSGDDDAVLQAMLVSTLSDSKVSDMSQEGRVGRIRALMRGRHGTPFEHNMLKFRSEAPIFVYREWHRHRIGISINEQSGRYTEFKPVFYIPPPERPFRQTGKPMAYNFENDNQLYAAAVPVMQNIAMLEWREYKRLIEMGVALEVARMHLGVNIYSSMFWTCNARSLMAFLSLRTRSEPFWTPWTNGPEETPAFFEQNPGGAYFPSTPMWEIEACARAMEQVFAEAFPITYSAWNEFGRVAP